MKIPEGILKMVKISRRAIVIMAILAFAVLAGQGKKEVYSSLGCRLVSDTDSCSEIRALTSYSPSSTLYILERTSTSCTGSNHIVCVSDENNQECSDLNPSYSNYLTCSGSGGTCTDSDGSATNYQTKGCVTVGGNTLCDECISSTSLSEGTCVSGSADWNVKNCADYGVGWGCSDGKCAQSQTCTNPTANSGQYTCSNGKIWNCDPTDSGAVLGWVYYQDCTSLECQSTGTVQNSYEGLCKSGTCTDSDGGRIYDIKGTVTYNSINYPDTCVYVSGDYGNRGVKEYYCSNGIKAEEIKDCPELFGMADCADGICVECKLHSESTDPSWQCTEKYGNGYTCTSNNICQQTGKTCSEYSNNYGACLTGASHTCSTDKTSIFTECKDLDIGPGTTWCWTQKQNCGVNEECIISGLNIFCQPIGGGCSETDSGLDYENYGVLTKGGTTFVDDCIDGYNLKEVYCKSDSTIGISEYDCRLKGADWYCGSGLIVGDRCLSVTSCNTICEGWGDWSNPTDQCGTRTRTCPAESDCEKTQTKTCLSTTCTSCTAWSNSTNQCGTRICEPDNCIKDGYGESKSCGGGGGTGDWMKYLWIFGGFMVFALIIKMMGSSKK